MQVSHEIRLAFLHAMWSETTSLRTFATYMRVAFEATETEGLLCWMTLQEKVKFGRKLLELTGGELDEELKLNIQQGQNFTKYAETVRDATKAMRTLDSDLREDR